MQWGISNFARLITMTDLKVVVVFHGLDQISVELVGSYNWLLDRSTSLRSPASMPHGNRFFEACQQSSIIDPCLADE